MWGHLAPFFCEKSPDNNKLFYLISSLIHDRPSCPLADNWKLQYFWWCVGRYLVAFEGYCREIHFSKWKEEDKHFFSLAVELQGFINRRFLSQQRTLPYHWLRLSKLERQDRDSLMDCVVINSSNNCIRDKTTGLCTVIKRCLQSAISLCEYLAYDRIEYFSSYYLSLFITIFITSLWINAIPRVYSFTSSFLSLYFGTAVL